MLDEEELFPYSPSLVRLAATDRPLPPPQLCNSGEGVSRDGDDEEGVLLLSDPMDDKEVSCRANGSLLQIRSASLRRAVPPSTQNFNPDEKATPRLKPEQVPLLSKRIRGKQSALKKDTRETDGVADAPLLEPRISLSDVVEEGTRIRLFATQQQRPCSSHLDTNDINNNAVGGLLAAAIGTQRFSEICCSDKRSIEGRHSGSGGPGRMVSCEKGFGHEKSTVVCTLKEKATIPPCEPPSSSSPPPSTNSMAHPPPTPSSSLLGESWCPWKKLSDAPWDLAGWGIAPDVAKSYRTHFGVVKLFPWQRACLFEYFSQLAQRCHAQLPGAVPTPQRVSGSASKHRGPASVNLLYSAPTSGGKTLVAEIIMLRRLLMLGEGRKAMLIVPYVSIAEEKTNTLSTVLSSVGVRVKCHAGHKGQRSLADDIMVCTPEKANVLVNLMIEKRRIGELCVVIVDELHQIGDTHGNRGYLLEVLVTKLALLSREGPGQLVVVGLSATLRNSEQLAAWMNDALLFTTDFRPVPLKEHCVCQGLVLSDAGRTIRKLDLPVSVSGLSAAPPVQAITAHSAAPPQSMPFSLTDVIVQQPYLLLAMEAATTDGQSLLFCPSRALCEKVADELRLLIVRLLGLRSHQDQEADVTILQQHFPFLGPRLISASALRADLRRELGRSGSSNIGGGMLKRSKDRGGGSEAHGGGGGPAASPLHTLVSFGLAFHHAALSTEERAVIEGGFRSGAIWALCCTTTLATGVNLPARRVIFTAPRIAFQPLDPARYKQAAGRAGRMGLDHTGEAYVCCRPQERLMCLALVSTALPPVSSNFAKDKKGMMRVLLEGISAGIIQRVEDVERTIRQTLLAVMSDDYGVVFHAAKTALEFLETQEFIRWSNEEERFTASLLGEATVASTMAPDEALVMFQGLDVARQHMVLSHDLHLVYFCTPIFHGVEPNWSLYQRLVSALPPDAQTICNLIGVSEAFLDACVMAPPPRLLFSPDAVRHRRFYGSLILLDAIREVPWSQVLQKFAPLPQQELLRLMESAATFASMAGLFCERLNWWQFPPMFQHMASRLQRGVEPELVEIMRIPGLVPWRARELFKRGFRTVLSIASAQPCELETVMSIKAPFEITNAPHIAEAAVEVEGSSVRQLAAVLQSGARCILAEEATSLQETINEIHHSLALPPTGVSSMLTLGRHHGTPQKRPRDSATSATLAVCEPAVRSRTGARPIQWNWLGPMTPQADFDHWCQELLQASSVSILPLCLMSAQHPIVALHYLRSPSTATDTHQRAEWVEPGDIVLFFDDGCVRPPHDATPDLRERHEGHSKGQRGMRFLFQHLLPSSVQKVVSPAKEFWLQCLNSGWVFPVDAAFSVVNSRRTVDPVLADWLLSPEDRNVSVGRQPTVATLAERLGMECDDRHAATVCYAGEAVQRHASRVAQLLFGAVGPPGDHLGPIRKLLWECVLQHDVAQRYILRLEEADLLHVFVNVEMPLTLCLAQMEHVGIGFDASLYQAWDRLMHAKAQQLTEEAYHVTGSSNWSLSAPKDCAKMLFDVLKMPCLERTFDAKFLPSRGGKLRRARVAKESRSTKASVLKALEKLFPECRLPGIIREFRTMQGWLEKFIRPLIELVGQQPRRSTDGGQPFAAAPPGAPRRTLFVLKPRLLPPNHPTTTTRRAPSNSTSTTVGSVHGSLFQMSTATGRLAMNDPNLQTIPHPISFRLPPSLVPTALHDVLLRDGETANASDETEPSVEIHLRLRHAFVARPGYVLISADYKQIEARLLAHFSKDPRLVEAFAATAAADVPVDIFVRMAGDIFKKSISDVSLDERRQAKALCYAMLYGKGKSSIADDLEISEDEAQGILDRFRAAFPVAHEFLGAVASDASRQGYVETITKRRRWLPFAASTIPKFRSASARIAVNTVCQGSAADMVKLAMIRLCEHPLFLGGTEGEAAAARIVLQIHDELLVEAVTTMREPVAQCLHTVMSDVAVELATVVPFPVSISIGSTWAALEPWEA